MVWKLPLNVMESLLEYLVTSNPNGAVLGHTKVPLSSLFSSTKLILGRRDNIWAGIAKSYKRPVKFTCPMQVSITPEWNGIWS